MARTYEQVRKQWETLWKIGQADDMTGGYVDQNDLEKLLKNPTKQTAKKCMESQIEYWLDSGTEEKPISGGDYTLEMLIEEYPQIRKIAEDYGYIDEEETE